ncbi:MAG: hypothetical protein HY301_08110 [Verrucomicrobia bacterium]|nr:hypothetical protein [Verrucomicrobiota bacterium]
MKKLTAILAGLCVLALVAPTTSFAAKAKKDKGGVDVFGRFDKNHNGVLDDEEKTELKKAFETDATLKSLDLNGDGKLDDGEIAAIKPAGGKKKKKNT